MVASRKRIRVLGLSALSEIMSARMVPPIGLICVVSDDDATFRIPMPAKRLRPANSNPGILHDTVSIFSDAVSRESILMRSVLMLELVPNFSSAC